MYPSVPAPGADSKEIVEFLQDIDSRKEFSIFADFQAERDPVKSAFIFTPLLKRANGATLTGLQLHGAQLFISNFHNPNTPFTRLLLNWKTGSGKTIAMGAIGKRYSDQIKLSPLPPEQHPSIFVIGLTKNIFQKEFLRNPEFGFVTAQEVNELNRLKALADTGIPGDVKAYTVFFNSLRRRLSNKARGGYYKFYGYQEFANRLFIKSKENPDFDIVKMYTRSQAYQEDFLERIQEEIKKGNITVNEDLINELRGGLIMTDEIHDTYNITSENNYGIAIQYVLDRLGNSVRAVFASATFASGSSAECIDLLNFLVPGAKFRRRDFFDQISVHKGEQSLADTAKSEIHGTKLILKPGALERIGKLSAGRVSFLFDTDIEAYPRRIIEGKEMPGIPYLKFDACEFSEMHVATLKHYLDLTKKNAELRQNNNKTKEKHDISDTLDNTIDNTSVIPHSTNDNTENEPEDAKQGGKKPRLFESDITKISLPPSAHTLYDMVFPNPDSETIGLYLSSNIPQKYLTASEEWKAKTGVIVQKVADQSGSEMWIISGNFLRLGNLEKYAIKYANMVKAMIDIIKKGPGRWMIYHHRVRLSGVLILQEIFKMNGFIDDVAQPNQNTLCAICGVIMGKHNDVRESRDHTYKPARFIMAHYHILRKTMDDNIDKFIAPSNVNGDQYRLLIGSRIIRQSYDLKGVQGMLGSSLPTDIPTLLQVWGRIVRKGSAIDLPEDRRYAIIRTFATPIELTRYEEKMKDYIAIQEIEREFRKYAIDAQLNYPKLVRAFPELSSGVSTLEALPYKPVIDLKSPIDKSPSDKSNSSPSDKSNSTGTFQTYYVKEYIEHIEKLIRALFRARIVYILKDLIEHLKQRGSVRGNVVDPKSFTESEIALALRNVINDPSSHIHYFPPYFILDPSIKSTIGIRNNRSSISDLTSSMLIGNMAPSPEFRQYDIESYIRRPVMIKTSFSLKEYTSTKQEDKNFSIRLAALEQEEFERPVDIILNYDAEFHKRLMEKIIEMVWSTGSPAKSSNLYLALTEYQKYQIIFSADEYPEIFKNLKISVSNKTKPIGYIMNDTLNLMDPNSLAMDKHKKSAELESEWHEVKLNRQPIPENDYMIGFMERKVGKMKLKLRPSFDSLKKTNIEDARMLSRGAICETKFRRDQIIVAKKLGVEHENLSSQILCKHIKYKIVDNEIRQISKKHENRIKWFYFFNETVPKLII
jgi:hypothetical protein